MADSGKTKKFYQKTWFKVLAVLFLLGVIGNIFDGKKDQESKTEDKSELQASVDSLKEVREAERMNLIASFDSLAKAHNLKATKDDFEDAVFYQPSTAPKHTNENGLYPYLVKVSDNVTLRYRIQYTAEDWLFIQRVLARLKYKGGSEKSIELYKGKFERDSDTRIWEWADTEVSSAMYLDLLDLERAESVKIRFEGKQYTKDRSMTTKEKKALTEVLGVYKQVRK